MAHTGINDATAWLAVGFDNFLEQEHVRLLNGPSLRPFWDEAEPPTLMDLIGSG
ncbi:hypothetical protein G5V59_12960 [Nocardioides sp. W3-2-3]|uniref:hypothetical protein n=1 Tax=Nocardioides convexus TaxID=2712224 RepID=UPI0024189CA5|nr:hypothetical protein [Nocardioides convexus]NHA00624.1 hypothetical protein [Nocardioides convexus]